MRDLSDDGRDLVSMHHRVRRDLHLRLKHAAVDRGCAVTDLVNEAIEALLSRSERPAALPEPEAYPVEFIAGLRQAKRDGTFFETVSSLSKDRIVKTLDLLGRHADRRASRDRLTALLAYEVESRNVTRVA